MDWTRDRVWALLRLVLGFLQISGTGLSLALLLSTGVTTVALVAVVVTALCTTVSVLLFGARTPPHRKRKA